MDKNLITYLENIVNLEKSVYTQTQTVTELDEYVSSLAIPGDFDEPRRPSEYDPNWFEGTWTGLKWGALLGGVVGLFCGSILNGILIGACICFLIVLILHASEASSENSARDEQYEAEKNAYDYAVALDEIRINEEEVQREKLSVTLQMMEDKLDATKELLDQYYARNIIFPKYRNLIAMCSIYEYFISGRCEQLAGHEGAYNIYETEVRLERIYTELEKVVNKLDEIKNNQYVLYDAIQEGNRVTQSLVAASIHQAQLTERLIESTEVATYYQQQTASETNQIKWLMLYDATKKK